MINIKNLSISTKDGKDIIDNLSININNGDRLAIIGEEGNGKSTLLKCIYNKRLIQDYTIVTGNILCNNICIGYLEQFLDSQWNFQSVENYFLKQLPESEIDYEKYNNFFEVECFFKLLNLNNNILSQDRFINVLSGGEKVKLQIIKILLNKPDILILDEPTNDIDIETLEWLEQFIITSTIPIIYVSHDETLLEKTSNCILHLEKIDNKKQVKHTFERIGYKQYLEKRLNLLQKQEQMAKNEKREYDKQLQKFNQICNKVEYEQETISRQNPSGGRLLKKKMKSVKALEKRLEDKVLTKRPNPEEIILIKFHNRDTIHKSKIVLDYNLDTLKINEKILKENIHIKLIGKEKMCIIGRNGTGKTTLLKKIYEYMKNRKDIKVGYMPQNYDDVLDLNISAIEFLKNNNTKDEETKISTYLGSMKFTRDEMLENINNLSGGQKAKLFITKLILDDCDVLLLDEPTRNLSPLSNPVIREVLKNFNGAILSVSHDRKYIHEVANKVFDLDKNLIFNI